MNSERGIRRGLALTSEKNSKNLFLYRYFFLACGNKPCYNSKIIESSTFIRRLYLMKKVLTLMVVIAVSFSIMFLFGCGGTTGQKINSVADEESEVMSEASERYKEELPTTYIVEDEDTLWSIAQKPEIYGNRFQWPIIYDANRDILDDYTGELEAGSKLIIPRNIRATEIEDARRRAQQLGIPPSQGKVASARASDGGVAGMTERKVPDEGGSYETTDEYLSSEPTPIPEPVKKKAKKSGGSGLIIVLLLGLVAAALIVVLLKKKKKQDDEDGSGGPLSGGDSNNILG